MDGARRRAVHVRHSERGYRGAVRADAVSILPRRARQILSEPLSGGRMVSGQAVHVPRLRRRFVFGFHEDRRPAFLAV